MKIETVKKGLAKLKPNISWPTLNLPKFKPNIKKITSKFPELKTFFIRHETCTAFVISAIVPGGFICGATFYIYKYSKNNKQSDPFLCNPINYNQQQDK